MENKIQIDNQELLVLLEIKDSEYGNITSCLDENDNKVYVIDNKIINDENIVHKIEKKYNLEIPEELKKIIF